MTKLIATTEVHVQTHAQSYSFWPEGLDNNIEDPLRRLTEWYMRGQCSVFASILYERTGWPLCGVYAAPGKSGKESVRHWVCKTPTGFYADARGWRRSEEEVIGEYVAPDGGERLVILESTVDDVVTRFRRPAINYDITRQKHLNLLLPDLYTTN